MSSTPQSILAAAKPCAMVMHPHLEPVAAQLEADYTVLADAVPPFASLELAALSR